MLLEFNVIYHARASLKESSFLHDTEFQKHVEVVIEEIDGSSAPVAARWPDADIRLYEGRTYRQAFETVGKLSGNSMFLSMHHIWFDCPYTHRLLTRSDVLDRLKSGTQMPFLHGRYFKIDSSRKSSFPPSRYHRYEYSDEKLAKDQARIDRWVRDVVMIDGEFWIVCPPPIYQVSKPGNVYPTTRRHARWSGDRTDPRSNADYDECANATVFNHTQLAEAISLSKELYGQANVTELEVFIPEALPRLDVFDRVEAIYQALLHGCELTAGRRRGIATPGLLRSWADAVESMGAATPDVDRVAQALDQLLPHLNSEAVGDDTRIIARHALDLIDSREIAVDLVH
jgi:hypothetical protein